MSSPLLNTSMLAEIFHSFPHVDFNFFNTTLLFSPDNSRYQQALFYNGMYLFLIAAVFFLLFSVYFMVCSCYFSAKCRPQSLKPRPARSRCLKLVVAFFAICSCASLGIAFYGNNQTQDGVRDFAYAAKSIYNDFDLYKFKNTVVIQFTEQAIVKGISPLEDKISFLGLNQSESLIRLKSTSSRINVLLMKSGNLLKDVDVDLETLANKCNSYDSIRWWITLCILLWQLLLVLLILYASFSKKRRCPLIVLTIMAVICLLLMMSSVSLEVPLSIGAADLCKSPKESLLQYVKHSPAKDLVIFYMECVDSIVGNPLQFSYERVDEELKVAQDFLKLVKIDPFVLALNDSNNYINIIEESLLSSQEVLEQLMKIVGCKDIHAEFEIGIKAVCSTTLGGLGLLILSSLITTLLLIFILLCITPIWKAMTPLRPILKRDKYGVHLVTDSYQGPPGGSESFHGSSSFDASYKSIDDSEFEHLPLLSGREKERPPSYQAIHGSTEFLSVEEEDRRSSRRKDH